MDDNSWRIVEREIDPAQLNNYETLFALCNGTIGTRGTFAEGLPGLEMDGTFVNGFYDSLPISYGEKFPGYPTLSQTMIPVANAKLVRLWLEDEPFNLATGTILAFERSLDMRSGVLQRRLTWQSPQGRTIQFASERLVLFTRRHNAVQRISVTPLDFDGNIVLFSGIDGDVWQKPLDDDPRLGEGFQERPLVVQDEIFDADSTVMLLHTRSTGFGLACGIRDEVDQPAKVAIGSEGLVIGRTYTFHARHNQPLTHTKHISYVTTQHVASAELVSGVWAELDSAISAGFDALKAEQRAFLDDFWSRTDIEIRGDETLQRGIRFNLFHLLQSVGRDGHTNIAAKGLTGPGYEGHTFWDTEIYILPFFLYNNPDISRKLLEYRYHMLDKARQRAREMAHPAGALYPWRTISGDECSAYFPAGTAQYHINADIAFAVKRYWDATQDAAFMRDYGAEMLFETARLWPQAGHFNPLRAGQFCIDAVTGPDEYTAIVNNNAYTNLMARENLRFAVEMAAWLREHAAEKWADLSAEIHLTHDEIANWQAIAANMFIPYDAEQRIFAQDDSFLHKAVWDFERHPVDTLPLLLKFHPLILYRYQVCKQADLLLAQHLLHDQFDLEQKRRDFHYYEPLTTHDSSLSMCVFSMLSAELGYLDKAYDYFAQTAIADLADKKGNTKAGIHAANMGGAWQAIVFGFAGMRVGDGLSFKPQLPAQWEGYRFRITYRNRLIELNVSRDTTQLTLLTGNPITITLNDKPLELTIHN